MRLLQSTTCIISEITLIGLLHMLQNICQPYPTATSINHFPTGFSSASSSVTSTDTKLLLPVLV